jgi:murein L,D-transpeptidase YafK
VAAMAAAGAGQSRCRAVAAPVAQQATVTRPVVAGEDAVRLVASRLEAWRLAWESKDASRYLAFYASSFVPADKRARAAWEADRRSKLDKKGRSRSRSPHPASRLKVRSYP